MKRKIPIIFVFCALLFCSCKEEVFVNDFFEQHPTTASQLEALVVTYRGDADLVARMLDVDVEYFQKVRCGLAEPNGSLKSNIDDFIEVYAHYHHNPYRNPWVATRRSYGEKSGGDWFLWILYVLFAYE